VEARAGVANSKAQLQLKEAEVNIQKSVNALNMLLGSLKDGATVSSALASAALSAVNLSGSISGQSSDSKATNTSTNTTHSYTYAERP